MNGKLGKLIAIVSGAFAVIDTAVAAAGNGGISPLSYVVLGLCVLGVAIGAVLSDIGV